jgi:DNA-binding winged helix-turn-helix (wHTH) protein/tetratricopeptide (TPR) repeat protein
VPHAVLRFGVFDLNPATGELHRAGLRVRLQPQPLRVLEILATRAGAIVSREELRQAVWGESTFVDFEHGLNFCINQVRRALGDSATAPRFVETVPRRGYRFIGPVERIEPVLAAPHVPAALVPAPPVTDRAPRFRSGWRFAVVALAALLVGGDVDPVAEEPAIEIRPAAREAYLKGLYHTQRGPAEWAEGVRCLERAVAEEPSFRAAQTALAGAYVQLAEARLRPGRVVFPLARSAALAALRGRRESAAAHVWLGVARLAGEWDWAGAEREMREAIALAPDLAVARRSYAALLSARGDDDRALSELAQARRIDPLCTAIMGEAALIHYRARRYGEAAALWREGLRVREDSGGHEGLFHLYRQEGDLEAASVEALRVMALVGVPETEVRKLGRRTPAQIAEAFVRGAVAHVDRPGSFALPDRLAILHATLGDRERALAQLEVAVSERSPQLLAALRDPAFDGLRGEPRFRKIVTAVGRSEAIDLHGAGG